MKLTRRTLVMTALAIGVAIPPATAEAKVDTRMPPNRTVIAAAGTGRLEFVSYRGAPCTGEDPGGTVERAPYYVYFPADAAGKGKPGKYAALIFLHGLGEQGPSIPNMCWNHGASTYTGISNGLKILQTGSGGPPTAIANNLFNPPEKMVVISLQSPQWGGFPADAVRLAISDTRDSMLAEGIELDGDRIYITGLSMGGGGVTTSLTANPTDFAAAVTIEAAVSPDTCTIISQGTPIWEMGGANNGNMAQGSVLALMDGTSACPQVKEAYPTYRPQANYTCTFNGQSCTQVLASNGELRRGTIMPGISHGGWAQTYNGSATWIPAGDSIYRWMLEHRNSDLGRAPYPFSGVTQPSPSPVPSPSPSVSPSPKPSATPSPSPSPSASASPSPSPTVTVTPTPTVTPTGTPVTIPNSQMTATSAVAADHASSLIDGITGTDDATAFAPGWHNDSVFPVYAVIDLGDVYDVTQVDFYVGSVNPSSTLRMSYLPQDQNPNTGTFVALSTKTGNQWGTWSTFPAFNAPRTRYLKVGFNSNADKMNVSEIRVKGVRYVAPAPQPSPSPTPTALPSPVPSAMPQAVIPNNQLTATSPLAADQAGVLIDGVATPTDAQCFAPGWHGANTFPLYAVIDLGDVYDVSQVDFFAGNQNANSTLRLAYLPQGQTPATGTFVALSAKSSAVYNAVNTFPAFTPVRTRYLRVGFDTSSDKMGVSELKITGGRIVMVQPNQ